MKDWLNYRGYLMGKKSPAKIGRFFPLKFNEGFSI